MGQTRHRAAQEQFLTQITKIYDISQGKYDVAW